MNKIKCPKCGSAHTKRNGKRNGTQTYKCCECGCQFRRERLPSDEGLWQIYQSGKQTISELSELYGVSQTGRVLYMAFIQSEKTSDYQDAVKSIEDRGYSIRGIILDGKQNVFKAFSSYKLQMCHFHMQEIIKRYLTKNPRLKAARALKELMKKLNSSSCEDFESEYGKWKDTWKETLNKRSTLKNGRTQFRHKRLRSAMHSLDWYMPYLFTFQRPDCVGMPNTNNKIEGTFSDLKKNLNNHSGMSKENRKRFICLYFSSKKQPVLKNDIIPDAVGFIDAPQFLFFRNGEARLPIPEEKELEKSP